MSVCVWGTSSHGALGADSAPKVCVLRGLCAVALFAPRRSLQAR